MKTMDTWSMEAVFIFVGIAILVMAGALAFLFTKVVEVEEQQEEKDDPCEKCLRWPECNGVDEDCPKKRPM